MDSNRQGLISGAAATLNITPCHNNGIIPLGFIIGEIVGLPPLVNGADFHGDILSLFADFVQRAMYEFSTSSCN